MHSTLLFLVAVLAVFSMGALVNGQQPPCYETRCIVFNNARCDGNLEMKSVKCGFPNKQRKTCCQHNKGCGHTGNCVPTACKGPNCPPQCARGQVNYDHFFGQIGCTFEIPSMGISVPGSKSFCCNP